MSKRFALSTFLLLSIAVLALLFSGVSFAQQTDCYTILVGKEATVDGSVIIAHNEDDRGELLVDWYIVPRLQHSQEEKLRLKNGALIDQVEETYSFLWLEIPGEDFADSYINEWGVVVASNQCPSKESYGDLVDGGVGYFLRRILIERAKSAREAVKIAGKIIEEVGYYYSGRTYCIADPDEAWMLSVVQGKHWVARRVPDDEVAIIPNYYTIDYVDLSDTLSYLGSPDIVQYAINRGWFTPGPGKEFSFREAYSPSRILYGIWNIPRHLGGLNLLAERKFSYHEKLPFSFKPKKKLSLEDIMNVLRYHYEGTEFEMNPSYNNGNPHVSTVSRICSSTNRYGFVAQLRSFLPREIGNVLWLAPRRPCVQPFIPWYSGITKVPPEYTRGDYRKALENHFKVSQNIKLTCPEHAYWVFSRFADMVDSNYASMIGDVKVWRDKFQNKLLDEQKSFENRVLKVYKKDQGKARKMLTDYTCKVAQEVLKKTEEKLRQLRENVH